MPKLRERYDQLRLQAQRRRTPAGHQPGMSTTERKVAAAREAGRRAQALIDQQQSPLYRHLEIAS